MREKLYLHIKSEKSKYSKSTEAKGKQGNKTTKSQICKLYDDA